MTEIDLQSNRETVFEAEEIRKGADRALFMNEFAVAYDEPIEDVYVFEKEHSERGYLMAFVRGTGIDAPYERVQFMSGDDRMIRNFFSEMASEGPSRIEHFIG